tara:strand:- start:15455 stop:16027 length:573 start_codon:yes stop_codon:yes gene_type:complete
MNIDQFSYLKNTISKNNISEEIYNNSKLSSVGVLFRSNNNQHEIMLIKRSKRLRTHPGEWAFPGGKIENNDNNLRDTFFREIKEEVGIDKKNINLIGRIKSFVTTTGYVVVPYVGILNDGYKIDINHEEVDKYFFLDFSLFYHKENHRTITFLNSYNEEKLITHNSYAIKGKYIWGATAKIIRYISNIEK